MVQMTYEIRVAGVLPLTDLEDMGAVPLAPDQTRTVLYGLADQAALYGLLERLKALGIEVVEVRRIPTVAASGEALGEATGEASGTAPEPSQEAPGG